ncbi:unnamed protein product, partial [Rotaria sp. Silwood1]
RGGTSISIPGGDSRKWTHSRPKRRKYQNFQNFNIKIFFSTILLNIKCRGGTSISIPGGDSRRWTHIRPKRRKY